MQYLFRKTSTHNFVIAKVAKTQKRQFVEFNNYCLSKNNYNKKIKLNKK